jgi:hypothetical protein
MVIYSDDLIIINDILTLWKRNFTFDEIHEQKPIGCQITHKMSHINSKKK